MGVTPHTSAHPTPSLAGIHESLGHWTAQIRAPGGSREAVGCCRIFCGSWTLCCFLMQVIPGYITCLGCEAMARPPGCQELRPLEHYTTQHQALVAGAPLGAWLFPIRGVLATSLATHIITHTYCLRMPLTWNNFKGRSPGSSPESPGPGRSFLYPGTCWPRNQGIPGTELRTSPAPLHTTSWHCLALPKGGGTCLGTAPAHPALAQALSSGSGGASSWGKDGPGDSACRGSEHPSRRFYS